MAELRSCVQALGLHDVSTYIASGNLLFDSDRDAAELEREIERSIEQRFGFPVTVIVLDRATYTKIVEAIPTSWAGDTTVRANVAFVSARQTRSRLSTTCSQIPESKRCWPSRARSSGRPSATR